MFSMTSFNARDQTPGKMLEDDDFEREVQLFLDEVEIQEIADTCTFEEYATAGSHTLVDGPGVAIAQKMGWCGNWQGLGLCGNGIRNCITAETTNIRRGCDRRGLGAEGTTFNDSKITIARQWVRGSNLPMSDSSPAQIPMTHHTMVSAPILAGYPAFSICIPFVYNNIRENRIRAIFRRLGFPSIEAIDFVKNHKTGNKANKVFVHFNAMTHRSSDPTINQTIEKILEGDLVKIMYDDPWFWNISQSRSKRPAYHKQSPTIVL